MTTRLLFFIQTYTIHDPESNNILYTAGIPMRNRRLIAIRIIPPTISALFSKTVFSRYPTMTPTNESMKVIMPIIREVIRMGD